jgi:hypothetical protein
VRGVPEAIGDRMASRGAPPMNSSASTIESTQSAVVCVAVAQA